MTQEEIAVKSSLPNSVYLRPHFSQGLCQAYQDTLNIHSHFYLLTISVETIKESNSELKLVIISIINQEN